MKRFQILALISAIFLLISVFFADKVFAAPIGVSITPIKWEISADRGQTIDKMVTAINPNDFPIKVMPEFQDFRVLENAGIQWIPEDVENPYRMVEWIKISREPISLAANGQTDLPFQIVIPQNASVGGHYAAIFFRAVIDPNEGNIGSIPRVGALIILNVNGDVSKSGEITAFSGPKFVDIGPVNFDVSLKNTGSTHYEPKTEITIQNIFGPRYKITSEQGKLIYPGVSRTLKTVWDKKYPLGLYFANLNFIDGNGVSYTKSIWFIGFPWKYFLILFAIAVALFYLIRYLRKHFKIIKVGA